MHITSIRVSIPKTSHFKKVFLALEDREFEPVLVGFIILFTLKNVLVVRDASGKAKPAHSSGDFNSIFH